MPVDPHVPTKHHPGSRGKLRVLRARVRAGLPLFNPNDAEGARQLNDVEPSALGRRSPLEIRILATITYKPVLSRDPAAQIGCKLGHNFSRALMQLHRAGVLEYDRRRGWRLSEVAEA